MWLFTVPSALWACLFFGVDNLWVFIISLYTFIVHTHRHSKYFQNVMFIFLTSASLLLRFCTTILVVLTSVSGQEQSKARVLLWAVSTSSTLSKLTCFLHIKYRKSGSTLECCSSSLSLFLFPFYPVRFPWERTWSTCCN